MPTTAPATLDIEPLISRLLDYNAEADADMVRRAYRCAEQAHSEQLRDSGAPYIEHPLAVAHMLADVASDAPTLAAGLLHDVVEDTTVSLETIREDFGEEVARLVDGVTKLSQAELSRRALEEAQGSDDVVLESPKQQERAANMRKIFIAMARDVRVMIIKLADRLHNMGTLESLSPERQKRLAEETLQVFAPLAHRLGIWHYKWQLEDLAFKYAYPEEYSKLSEALARTRAEREGLVEEVRQTLKDKLGEHGIEAEVYGRAKHLYSIWNKLRKQELSLDQLYDLIAVRVIVNTVGECYHVLGIVHQLWVPIARLFADHIARPKSNAYQSLHTKVIGPRGEPIEIQIRTLEMHRTAEYGPASHWAYKETNAGAQPEGAAPKQQSKNPNQRYEDKLIWLRQQLFDWQTDTSTDAEFMRSVVEDLFTDQVFVFTPRGDVIDLPFGSGPIDFAFRIHSELGLRCTGARVNGRLVPLAYQFRNGDVVEIMSRASAEPSYDWLNLAKTSHAKSRIRAWFRKQKHSENAQKGREALEREAVRLGLDPKESLGSGKLAELAKSMNYSHEEDLLAGIGHGHVAAASVLNKIRTQEPPKRKLSTEGMNIGRPATGKLRITADGMEDLQIIRARCCMPLPGEEVVGFVTRGKGIAIHREGCVNAQRAMVHEAERMQRVDWGGSSEERYPVALRLESMDRPGLMGDVMGIFSERKVNVEKANIRTRPGDSAVWDQVVDVNTIEELDDVVRIVSAIPDVLSVTRGSASGPTVTTRVRSRRRQASERRVPARGA